jgi:hypothetical protein
MPDFALSDGVKSFHFSVGIASVPLEIRTNHIPNNYTPKYQPPPPPPEGIPTLTWWWGLCGHIIPRAMLVAAYATGRASHARQVKGDDPAKRDTLVLQVGGLAWG